MCCSNLSFTCCGCGGGCGRRHRVRWSCRWQEQLMLLAALPLAQPVGPQKASLADLLAALVVRQPLLLNATASTASPATSAWRDHLWASALPHDSPPHRWHKPPREHPNNLSDPTKLLASTDLPCEIAPLLPVSSPSQTRRRGTTTSLKHVAAIHSTESPDSARSAGSGSRETPREG